MNQHKGRQRAHSYDRRPRNHGRGQQNLSDHVLQRVISYINNISTGYVYFGTLQKVFNEFSTEQLWPLLRNNTTHFHIIREKGDGNWNTPSNSDIIWIKTDLRLCEKHCRKDKHCSGECGELHLCRNYLLLGDMCCPFQKSGKLCAFGHNLRTHHNSILLQKHNLLTLSENELRVLFRRRICRSFSTMPQICIYYNGKGCSNKKCKSLHLCLDYVLERYHGPCLKNHSMSADQVALTLDLFAIDKSWPDDSVLEDLRSIMRKRIRHNSDVSSATSVDSYGCDDDDEDDNSDDDVEIVNGAEASKASDSRMSVECCSHCKEMRTEIVQMKEKMQNLENQLDRFLREKKFCK